MRGVLKWTGETIGGFCAAFLLYLVMGVFVGWEIAKPFEIGHGCWPTSSFFPPLINVSCDNALGEAFWFVTVALPNLLLFFSVTALKALSPPLSVSVAALSATVVMSLGGLFAWYRRAPLLAAMLAMTLAAEIAVMGGWL